MTSRWTRLACWLPDSEKNNNALLNHLLAAGQNAKNDREAVQTVLNGPKGSINVFSYWKILPGKRYLTTLRFTPRDPLVRDDAFGQEKYGKEQ